MAETKFTPGDVLTEGAFIYELRDGTNLWSASLQWDPRMTHAEAVALAEFFAAAPSMYAALEPFAHMAELFLTRARPPMGKADDAVIYEFHYGDEEYRITVGDCRDAYVALRRARGEAQ